MDNQTTIVTVSLEERRRDTVERCREMLRWLRQNPDKRLPDELLNDLIMSCKQTLEDLDRRTS